MFDKNAIFLNPKVPVKNKELTLTFKTRSGLHAGQSS